MVQQLALEPLLAVGTVGAELLVHAGVRGVTGGRGMEAWVERMKGGEQ